MTVLATIRPISACLCASSRPSFTACVSTGRPPVLTVSITTSASLCFTIHPGQYVDTSQRDEWDLFYLKKWVLVLDHACDGWTVSASGYMHCVCPADRKTQESWHQPQMSIQLKQMNQRQKCVLRAHQWGNACSFDCYWTVSPAHVCQWHWTLTPANNGCTLKHYQSL